MDVMLPLRVALRCQYPIGISLVVEWLRFPASIAEGMRLIPSQGCPRTKIPISCTVWQKKKKKWFKKKNHTKNILFQDGEKPSHFPSWQFIY